MDVKKVGYKVGSGSVPELQVSHRAQLHMRHSMEASLPQPNPHTLGAPISAKNINQNLLLCYLMKYILNFETLGCCDRIVPEAYLSTSSLRGAFVCNAFAPCSCKAVGWLHVGHTTTSFSSHLSAVLSFYNLILSLILQGSLVLLTLYPDSSDLAMRNVWNANNLSTHIFQH